MTEVNLVVDGEVIEPEYLYGIKVLESVLEEKKMTIQELCKLMKIEKSYVIGYDTKYMKKVENPHYHIHFADTRKLEALRKHKQKCMPNWGKTTKLYQAKDKANSDRYSWFGYAVKELNFFTSQDLDIHVVNNEAIIQLAFKKSKLSWLQKKEEKQEEKMDLRERIFSKIDSNHLGVECYRDVGPLYIEYYRDFTGKLPCKSTYERESWEYLISRELRTYTDYFLFHNGKHSDY